MERSFELEFRAEARAREAKALCIVTELRCEDSGNEAQTMLLDSSSMQDNGEKKIGCRGGVWRRNGRRHMCRKFQGIIEKTALGPHRD